MTLIKMGTGANPECPLCKNSFEKVPYGGDWYYICKRCEIYIKENDPSIHAWKFYVPEEDKEIFCPNPKCGHEMNYFFKADQFMKAMCPKCFASVTISEELHIPIRLIKAREEQERKKRNGLL